MSRMWKTLSIGEACLFLIVINTCAGSLTGATVFYSCPEVDSDSAGVCVEECSSHSDCPEENHRCCSNGCGHTCTTSVTVPYHTPSLVCPVVGEDSVGLCAEECEDCAEGELCCSNGCGHVCTQGVHPTPLCSTIRDSVMNSTLIGAFLPQCEEDGSFSLVQCHASTGSCWCVEPEMGEPVSDMTRFRQPRCNCSYTGQVFRVGETFPPEDGCGECSCMMDGEVSCLRRDCTDTMETTYPSCPAIRTGTTTDSADCDADCLLHSECPSQLKCCYNGCGYSCMQPHSIPYIDISSSYVEECPDRSDVPCAEVRGSCREEEFMCEEGEMCCDNDCATALCISTKLGSPCFTAVQLAASRNTSKMYGSYKPQCTTQGLFREIQCHAHFCWCVESQSGVPVSDTVPFEQANVLACAECVYNGVKYRHLERFPSGLDCNTCTCIGGTISCSSVDCDDRDYAGLDLQDDGWEWWHSMLIGCVVAVVVLVSIVLALIVGIVILMRQNSPHRHHHLKETKSDECEMVEYRNCHESVELKVPVEDNMSQDPLGNVATA